MKTEREGERDLQREEERERERKRGRERETGTEGERERETERYNVRGGRGVWGARKNKSGWLGPNGCNNQLRRRPSERRRRPEWVDKTCVVHYWVLRPGAFCCAYANVLTRVLGFIRDSKKTF
jgi:hypothetical protein